MKITVDIPDAKIKDLMQFTRATTKREAIATADSDYNWRHRMAKHARKA